MILLIKCFLLNAIHPKIWAILLLMIILLLTNLLKPNASAHPNECKKEGKSKEKKG